MKLRNLIFLWIIAGLIGHPFLMANPLPAKAQTNSSTPNLEGVDEVLDVDWAEPDFDEGEIQKNQPLQEFAQKLDAIENHTKEVQEIFSLVDRAKLIISEVDIDAVRKRKVDERVLKTLIYLVTPIEKGGAGFERIKVRRLIKGYTTEKRSFSKETPYEKESDANLSSHFFGQAIDISEIDQIKMKKKTKQKAFGVTVSSKTSKLPPVPIQVAWQSQEGKGVGLPGFYGETANQLFTNLSQAGIKEALSDYLDVELGELVGNNLNELAEKLGITIISEDFGLSKEGFERETDFKGLIKEMGRAVLAEEFGLEKESIEGDSLEEFTQNIGRGYLEKQMELTPGSLKGNNLQEIFKNCGKRKIEKELNLKSGSLDGDLKEKWKRIKENTKWKTYPNNQIKDEAFDLPAGSAEQIESEDENGLVLVGAGVLLSAVSAENAGEIIDKIRRKEPITSTIDIGEADLKITVDPAILKDVTSSDENKRKKALKKLGEQGINKIQAHANLGLGFSSQDIKQLLQGKISINELALRAGARKYETEFDLPKNSIYYTLNSGELSSSFTLNLGRALLEERGENPSKYSDSMKRELGERIIKEKIIKILTQEYGLDQGLITTEDVIKFFEGKGEEVFVKVASTEIDKALGFPKNGTLDIINGKKTAQEVLTESGAIRFGKLLGLNQPVSLEGNLRKNYGQALIESYLGLQRGSFTGNLSEIRNKNKQFDKVFSNPEKIDSLFGLAQNATKDLLLGKISPDDYSKKVADQTIALVTLDKVADYFGLENWKNLKEKKEDFENLIKTISNWDNASNQEKIRTFQTLQDISGNSWDEVMGFEPGTFAQIIANPEKAPEILLVQGMKKFNDSIFGAVKNIVAAHFKFGEIIETEGNKQIFNRLKEETGIDNDEDVRSFLRGDIKNGLTYLGLAYLVKEANQYLPPENQTNYSEARKAYFGDRERESSLLNEKLTGLPSNFSNEQIKSIKEETIKEIRNESRKNFLYKITDGFLRKDNPSIPVGFTKTMFEGNTEQQNEVIKNYAINLVVGQNIPLTSEQLLALDNFIKAQTPENLDQLKKTGLFGALDNYLSQYDILGMPVPNGTSEQLFKGALTGNYDGLTNLFKQAGKDWANDLVFNFADKRLGFELGQTRQIYQRYKDYTDALNNYRAIETGKQTGDLNTAQKNLANAKSLGIDLAVQSVFKKSFNKLDQKLSLPSGTTSGLVSYLITGNPAGLVLALSSKFFTVKVEFYGEKPICDKFESSSMSEFLSQAFTLSNNDKPGYERLTGDPNRDFAFYQRHAQCSVKRLIAALLIMPERMNDKEMKPTQILTYRDEDVDFWANKIKELYGKTRAQRGLQGLFSNKLMFEWVHVGY